MKISKIAPAVKTKGRYNIFIDDEFAFSVSEAQLIDLGLKKDQEITAAELTKFKNESDFGKNYLRALDLISRRPRSQQEIRDYAWRKKWLAENRDRVIAKLQTQGYLNDEKFAASYVRSRAHLKNLSRRQMEQALLKKGIQKTVIQKTLADSEEYDERQALQNLIIKKRRQSTNDQKLAQYLLRQGFNYDDVKTELKP